MPKVLVGMSGGVDSTVCALLLKEQGYEVLGVTLKIWKEGDSSLNDDYLKAASNAALKIGIRHQVVDVSKEFHNTVVNYFVDEYLSGRTPFPCAVCNPQLKWKTLLDVAKSEGCEYVATGHYVRLVKKNNKFYVAEGRDPDKDQSFFLWGLDQHVLSKALFPLGIFLKDEVKALAVEYKVVSEILENESIGICFAEEKNYRMFLKNQLASRGVDIKEGWFVESRTNKYISKHKGYPYYTVGQRHGLNNKTGKSLYVQSLDTQKNLVFVGEKNDLFKTSFLVKDYRFVDLSEVRPEKVLNVKIRYRKQLNECTLIILDNNMLMVNLIEPLDSIAPGQTAVFYDGDCVVGGGFINLQL